MNQRYVEAMADVLADESSLIASSDEKAEFLLAALITELRRDPAAVEAIMDNDSWVLWSDPTAMVKGILAALCDYLAGDA